MSVFITIDPYYTVQQYNEALEALKNNNVEYNEFILSKPPFHFYLELPYVPLLVNYDELSQSNERYLVNIVKPLTINDAYIYMRRDSYSDVKGLLHYAVNDALKTGQETGEGIFFSAEKDEVLRISKEYPRKIFFFGKYFNRKYKVFFTDSLLVKNFLNTGQILTESNSFKYITELEVQLNYSVFHLKDRLEKLSQTPYIYNGIFYPVKSIRPEISDKYVLS